MNYFIEEGHDIQNSTDMNKALCSATRLCGFTSNVVDITKAVKHKSCNLINKAAGRAILSKVHNIAYDKTNNQFRVWQYEGIGAGKLCSAGKLPQESEAREIIPFSDAPCGEGSVAARKQTSGEPIPCTKPLCIKIFKTTQELQKHLDTGKCKHETAQPTQLSKIRDMWTNRYTTDARTAGDKSVSQKATTEAVSTDTSLSMGWAIPVRSQRRITKRCFL